MTADRRFPNLHPIDGRPLPGLDPFERKQAARVAGAVTGRVPGLRAYFNARTGGIFFCYGEPSFGPLEFPFKTEPSSPARATQGDIDEYVRTLQLGRMKKQHKDRIMASQAAMRKHDEDEAKQRRFADIRPDSTDYAAFLDRKRRGVGTLVTTPA